MSTAIADKLAKARKAATNITERPKPKAYSIEDDDLTKLLLYGHSGSGKTFIIVGLLLLGERVLILSSDFGSNGLVTVKQELKKRGRLELLKNLRVVDLSTYEHIIEFLEAPAGFVDDIEEFDPTVLMWEGFSTFNIDILDEYILSMAPGAEGAGELRHAGFTHTKQDWQGMKRGTVRAVRRFLAATINGKRLHKILTALEAAPDVDELTGKSQRSVLVHGTGKTLMNPGFDAIIECFKEEKDGQVRFFYRCEGDSSKYLVKSRGYNLRPIEEADPVRLWTVLTGREEKI